MIYFTSDEHHFHEEIIDYCQEPFTSHIVKSDTIIENHNKLVKRDDIVCHLGDFTFLTDQNGNFEKVKTLLSRYKKVQERILIIGNHDEFSLKEYKEMGFDVVLEYMTFMFESHTLFLVHDPSFYQPKIYDRICICGHVHNLFKLIPGKKIFNASVDVNNFNLVSVQEVISALKLIGNLT